VLAPEPVGVAYYAWYHRDDRPLHEFAYKVRDGVGAVGTVAAHAAIVGGVALANAAIEDALHDDEDDEPAWLKRQRKRDRKRPAATSPARR
jgi:hypothetical protein